ncbi:MAG: 50S ribosomal protein L6 [bacterium]|nr:50S ribosomal protein L6 [bacterium]
MSKIGKLPIELKTGVLLTKEDSLVKITGPKGVLTFSLPNGIDVKTEEDKIIVFVKNSKNAEGMSALFGLSRALIANMVKGVTEGFEKKLELSGVGYRGQILGNDLVLSVGFSHTVKIQAPEGIKFSVAENKISVCGMDKTLVGDMAAKIRSVRPPEPYKGKGISYLGEKIRRKAGKVAKAVGTK